MSLDTFEKVNAAFRTDGVAKVCDAVRETGMSAHPKAGEGFVSPVVLAVAIGMGVRASNLQVQVNAYAEALDRLSQ
jgi:hypothetical protein